MGYDISFHPISEEKINEWYFDVLKNKTQIKSLAKKYKIDNDDDDFYENKYQEIIEMGIKTTFEKDFDSSHAYYIANIQGLFGEFFYIRGASFSFIEDEPIMNKYYTNWQDIIPNEYANYTIYNKIQSNYYAGKFISYANVCQLLEDYNLDTNIKTILDNQFSHKRITVLLKALNYAKENKFGLLEADGVMEPNPTDLNKSTCYSNLFNCDIEGPLLFQEAVIEQIKEVEKQATNKLAEKTRKKGFLGRLFGKK